VYLLLLLLGLCVDDCGLDVEEQVELPEGDVSEEFLLSDFLEDGALLGVGVVGAVVGVAVEDDLIDAFEVDFMGSYL
jgi:hypothetical protein